MKNRYIATITGIDTDHIRIWVVDQKQSNVVFDSTVANDLLADTKKLILARYGPELTFQEEKSGEPG